MDRKKRRGLFSISFFRIDFIALSILTLMGVMFVGGIVPKMEITPSSTSGELIPVPGSGTGGGKSSLQLNPIKFKKCNSTIAVDFLVDRSGSMQGDKIKELTKGLQAFTSNLADNSVVGMESFAVDNTQDVPISYFKDVKTQLSASINGLKLRAIGATYTKDAFQTALTNLTIAIPKFPPSYKFALIFISDGVPETTNAKKLCNTKPLPSVCSKTLAYGCRCFAVEQDPTEIANQIKAKGIKIFSIAYLDKNDQALSDRLQALLRNTASSPEHFYTAPTADKVGDILGKIGSKLCEEQ
ncbi:VWA domain-containing protein [Patescibacteria group bacterium]|nr:VWA domain-containing protein [Patescibacteria group bacterium]